MLNGDQQRISELETILLSLGSLTRESDGASLARKLVGGSVRKGLILSYGLRALIHVPGRVCFSVSRMDSGAGGRRLVKNCTNWQLGILNLAFPPTAV